MAIEDKIKGLLAKGEGAASEAERDAFISKAHELMVKYAISKGDLQDGEEFETRAIVLKNGRRGLRRALLLGTIARSFGTVCFHDRNLPDRAMFIVGRSEMLNSVEQLYNSLVMDMFAGASVFKTSNPHETMHQRDGFMEGYIYTIADRLEELNKQTDEAYDGSFLPVLKSDYEKARESIEGLTQSVHRRVPGNSAAAMVGAQAASRASLGQSGIGTTRALPSG